MDPSRRNRIPLLRAARYPQAYVWFIFVSALDVMMTWVVLYFGGREVNALADYILQRWALTGMVVYKFALVVFVIFICEIVGHYRHSLGRKLAVFAVFITIFPVVVAFTHLLAAVHGRGPPEPVPAGFGNGSAVWPAQRQGSTTANPASTVERGSVTQREGTYSPPSQSRKTIAVDRLTFNVPGGWIVEQPTSSVRKAQLRLPGEAAGSDAELVIYNFGTTPEAGGSVEANFSRWCGQFVQADGRDSMEVAARREARISGMAVHTIDISGRYVAAVRPGNPEKHDKPDHRMVGSVIISPEGKYFVKLLGPSSTVGKHTARYEEFLRSLKRN